MWSPTASSIVSQAARVGAMTMTRPVGGAAADEGVVVGQIRITDVRITRTLAR